jgi:hypothetical protein
MRRTIYWLGAILFLVLQVDYWIAPVAILPSASGTNWIHHSDLCLYCRFGFPESGDDLAHGPTFQARLICKIQTETPPQAGRAWLGCLSVITLSGGGTS